MMISTMLVICSLAVALAQRNLQSILSTASSNPLYGYPTNITQGILPKGFHSHNDYWRAVPFYSALAHGAISVEADVWLYNGTLYIGHDQASLTQARTFDALYVQPVLEVLDGQNPRTAFVTAGGPKNGVYDHVPTQTLYLVVDVKTDGAETWPFVVKALEPLRAAGYLTSWNGSAVTAGVVTVIGTGTTPLNLVQGVTPRDYFWDGPLEKLASTFANLTADVTPVASTDFGVQFGTVLGRGGLNETQAALLKDQVSAAHAKGIKVRYWHTPGWPIGTRNAVWRTLWDAGVDLLNVDDLDGVAKFWEKET